MKSLTPILSTNILSNPIINDIRLAHMYNKIISNIPTGPREDLTTLAIAKLALTVIMTHKYI